MKVKVDTEIIGKECFVISRSIMSGRIDALPNKITGILVDKDKKVSVRLADGKWISADAVFTENVEAEIFKFKQRYAAAEQSAAEH